MLEDAASENLFKQFCIIIDLIKPSNHHTAQEGECFCVPEMNQFWSKMSKSKAKDLVKMLAEAGRTELLSTVMK